MAKSQRRISKPKDKPTAPHVVKPKVVPAKPGKDAKAVPGHTTGQPRKG